MIKRILIISAIGFACASAQADVLTPQQALQRAMGQAPSQVRQMTENQVEPQLLYTSYAQGVPTTYIFEGANSQGYVVLAADDIAIPVLGYSDNGVIDPENMPDGLKYWLGMYDQEISRARANGATAPAYSAPVYANSSWTAIAPLCATQWDQSSPYNDLCPTKNGARAVTGCVATAMAQMMKYYNYPESGYGTLSNSSWAPISYNLADFHYDWANMLNTYNNTATDAQKLAVAQLMVSCGLSVNMSYSSSASGAMSRSIPYAFINNFYYDKNCHYLDRDYFSLSQWQEYIYNELKNVGPVVYAGNTGGASAEGHCFVCDGYDTNGYFHFNWGWSGLSDGYYVLTSLAPGSQGIGGASSNSGFNYDQCIILGAKKPVSGSDYYYQMFTNAPFSIKQPNATLGSNISITNSVYNGSVPAVSGSIGLKLTKSDGTSTYIAGPTFSNIAMNYGVGNLTFRLPSSLNNGTYTVSLAWVNSADQQQRDVLVAISSVSSYTMTVSGSNVTFKANEVNAAITISDIQLVSPKAYYNKRLVFSAKATNNSGSEFFSTIQAALYTDRNATSGSKPAFTGNDVLLDVENGQTLEFDYTAQFSGASEGQYTMRFINPSTYEWLSDAYTLTIEKAPSASETKLVISNFGFRNQPDLNQVDQMNMVVGFDITCETGYFDGRLCVGISEGTASYWRDNFVTPQLLLYEGSSDEVICTGSTTMLRIDREYHMSLYLGDNAGTATRLAGPINFYVAGSTVGIEDIEAEDEAAIEMYNLQGVKIDAETAAPGVYIKVAKYADGSTRTSRVYVK